MCVAKEVTVICNVVCEFSVQRGEQASHVGEVPQRNEIKPNNMYVSQ